MVGGRIHELLLAAALSVAVPCFVRAGPETATGGAVPVAPIPPSRYGAWTNAILLRTPAADAVVVPDIGRIWTFQPAGQSNLLHVSAMAQDAPIPRRGGGVSWREYGGAWGWPAPETTWPAIRQAGASPDDLFEGRAWAARAWRTVDGAAVCSMTLVCGAPLHIRVMRTIRLSPLAASLEIRQRVERMAESDIEVGPWMIARIGTPRRIVLPADPAEDDLVHSVAFHPPPVHSLVRGPESAVYHPNLGGEHRFAATDKRGWVAAELARHVLLLRGGGDTRLRSGVYAHRAAGYVELELNSDGRRLAAGEAIEQTVFMECFSAMNGLDARALAVRMRLLAGEKDAAAAP